MSENNKVKEFVLENEDDVRMVALIPGALVIRVLFLLVGIPSGITLVVQLIALAFQLIAFVLCLKYIWRI